MKGYPKNVELNRRLVKILDDLLAAGDWESSLFLRAASKRLKALRGEAEQLLNKALEITEAESERRPVHDRTGLVRVFISLYQAAGTELDRWQHLLKTLAEQSVTRPCYENEAHVRALIRGKTDSQREGYAILYVKASDILQGGGVQQDRLGHALLTLREGAVRQEHIAEFVHANRKRYRYESGRLIYLSEEDGQSG